MTLPRSVLVAALCEQLLADYDTELAEAYAFLDDLLTSNPNLIGRSVLQDYARFNRVMMGYDRWKRTQKEGA